LSPRATFATIGMHDSCANKHILSEHKKQLETKINSHKDRPQQLGYFFIDECREFP